MVAQKQEAFTAHAIGGIRAVLFYMNGWRHATKATDGAHITTLHKLYTIHSYQTIVHPHL